MQKAYIWFKRGSIVLAILGLIGLIAFMMLTHQAMDEASTRIEHDNVYKEDNVIIVEAEDPIANLVFYPGALVESEAYLVMAEMLSIEGITVYIVEMPLNLSILNPDAFDTIYDTYPSDLPWYLGGHSLGGAMTSRNDMEQIDGLILVAAYIDVAHDLSNETIDVLSITASEDEVL
ncbi:MAG: alpha/beta hydrolase, partial [Bacillota bacterium]